MDAIGKVFAAALAALVLGLSQGCSSEPKGEGAGEYGAGAYVDDAVITAKVKEAIFAEPSLKSFEIEVETVRGQVRLRGYVSSIAEIEKATSVARGVKGVRGVQNEMRAR